ncbi:MAG: hypothetical protein K8Q91_03270 [Candidatus Vogelbacteria bacterium]|nr:hypothetical protein [Candidatus Vogelbacteria bacterium]
MKNNKNIVVAFILGAIFVVFVYHAYMVYQVRSLTIQNNAQIQQIVQFLNGAVGPAASTPATTQASTPAKK